VLQSAGVRVLPAGFVTKNLQACHFCRGAEDAGLDLALELDAAITGLDVPVPIKIGYAGCALGTSEPLTKDISVVKMRDVFDIYIGGEAKGIKPVFAQLFMEKVPKEQIAPIVLGIIGYYRDNAKGKEKFRKFIDRMTLENIKKAVV
jgi:precorrin-3B C17-methyltransferase